MEKRITYRNRSKNLNKEDIYTDDRITTTAMQMFARLIWFRTGSTTVPCHHSDGQWAP